MKRITESLACTLLFAGAAAGMDDELERGVEALVADWDREDSPGGIVAVLHRGEPVLVRPFGMADLDGERPNASDTPFYIASMAKQFTAACVAHAAVADHFSLDDPLREHFPELPATLDGVRLHHLVHHRSGILDVYDLVIGADLGPEAVASNATAVKVLARTRVVNFRPGEQFLYSNSGYLLLAELLERTTDRSLSEYAREHLFAPLHMERSAFRGDPLLSELELAMSYGRTATGWSPREMQTGLIGPGGLYTTLDDLARWDRMWFEGGWGESDLRPTLSTAPELGEGERHHPLPGPYAFGLMTGHFRGLPTMRHMGGAFGFSAEMMRFPLHERTVIALSNASDLDARDLAEAVASLALADPIGAALVPTPTTVELGAGELARMGRIWREEDSGRVWILTLSPARSVVAALGDLKLDVAPTGPRSLVSTSGQVPLEFEFEPETGTAERMTIVYHDGTRVACVPLPFPPTQRVSLTDYAGDYVNESLDAMISFSGSGGRLTFDQRRPLLSIPPLIPMGRDVMVSDRGMQVDFHRDDEGQVVGCTVSVNRAWGIEFVCE